MVLVVRGGAPGCAAARAVVVRRAEGAGLRGGANGGARGGSTERGLALKMSSKLIGTPPPPRLSNLEHGWDGGDSLTII